LLLSVGVVRKFFKNSRPGKRLLVDNAALALFFTAFAGSTASTIFAGTNLAITSTACTFRLVVALSILAHQRLLFHTVFIFI
jgi:hypothetical protein